MIVGYPGLIAFCAEEALSKTDFLDRITFSHCIL